MSDREFWIIVRGALLTFVDAIERRLCYGKYKKATKPDGITMQELEKIVSEGQCIDYDPGVGLAFVMDESGMYNLKMIRITDVDTDT